MPKLNLSNLTPISKEQFKQIKNIELEGEINLLCSSNMFSMFHKNTFTKHGRKIKFFCIVGHRPLTVGDFAKAITEQMGLKENEDFMFETLDNGYGEKYTALVFKGGW